MAPQCRTYHRDHHQGSAILTLVAQMDNMFMGLRVFGETRRLKAIERIGQASLRTLLDMSLDTEISRREIRHRHQLVNQTIEEANV